MKSLEITGKTLLVLAAGLLPALYTYEHRVPVLTKLAELKTSLFEPAPCTKPITYSIGNFDESFGISKTEFLNDISIAANIWGDVENKKLFTYANNGTVKINLVYDYRQKATTEMQQIDTTIQGQKNTINTVKARYTAMKANYDSTRRNLDSQVSIFNADKSAYEEQVTYWNSKGGAPKETFQTLENTKNKINSEAIAINQATASFNSLTKELNSLSSELNRLTGTINSNIYTYNSVGQSTGTEFNEGEYTSNSLGERIDIYQFSNKDKLVRVLTHELGHALGLNHVNDEEAIMYMLNQSKNINPTEEDIAELKRVCRSN